MSLTYGEAKAIVAQYAGKGGKLPTAENLNRFTNKVLQYLLISGSPDSEKVFEVCAVGGVFTAPYALQTPLKARINGRVVNVVNKWFDFRSGSDFPSNCYDASNLTEEANDYYTAYDPPASGAHIGVLGTANEAEDSCIIIQGQRNGRDIFTNHKGADIAGELLQIRKNTMVWSTVPFDTITGIIKSPTNGYCQLWWGTGENFVTRGFLSDYSPIDEVPTYRRFRFNVSSCPPLAKLSILGKVRIKHNYSDADRIPFDNSYTLEEAARQINLRNNNQFNEASQADAHVQEVINREAAHKKMNNGTPLEFFYPNSAGTIKGIV